MVVTLLKLRFRVLANTLRRNPLQVVAVALGGVQALILVALALLGLWWAGSLAPEATQAVVVMGGAILVLGWMVVPLLFEGVEQTLDPLKLARFPIRTNQLMTAMLIAGVAWIPGIATVIVSMGTAIAWQRVPGAVVVALAVGIIGTLTCVTSSRVVAAVVGILLRGRGATRIAIGALVVVGVVAPIAAVLSNGAPAGVGGASATFASAVAVLGWTPLGAVWSVPGRIALGDVVGAIGASAVAVVTLVAALVLWRVLLGRSLRVPGTSPRKKVRGARASVWAWLPAGPVGAIAGRSLISWFRDARYARQLVLIPVMPTLLLVWWWLIDVDAVALAAGPVVAILLPMSMFAGLSYDGTAFAAQLGAGVRGVHDRLARAMALLIIAVPSVVIVQIVVAVIIARTADLVALLGLSLGALFVATAVISVSSARLVVPVARAGRNPFSAPAGAATTSILASYAVLAAIVVLDLPIAASGIAALVQQSAMLGAITLTLALVGGTGALAAGILVGGRVLDASGPAVLADLRLLRA